MNKAVLAVVGAVTFIGSASLGCPLEGVNVVAENAESPFTVTSDNRSHLSESVFNAYMVGQQFSYAQCKNSIMVRRLKMKSNGKAYLAVFTNEDDCDGGNAYGNLFDGKTKVAVIQDSEVYCK